MDGLGSHCLDLGCYSKDNRKPSQVLSRFLPEGSDFYEGESEETMSDSKETKEVAKGLEQ